MERSGTTSLEHTGLTYQKFQVEMPPNDELIPTPPLTRASTIETVESPPDAADLRSARDGVDTAGSAGYLQKSPDTQLGAGVAQVETEKGTFEMDHAYANGLAKHCRQPLYSLFNSKNVARSVVLKRATPATKSRRHASHFAGPVPNTPVANTNTDANTNATPQPAKRKMEGFWPATHTEIGFMPFMQPQEHAAGKQLAPQPGLYMRVQTNRTRSHRGHVSTGHVHRPSQHQQGDIYCDGEDAQRHHPNFCLQPGAV
jgi:hypothetical protein